MKSASKIYAALIMLLLGAAAIRMAAEFLRPALPVLMALVVTAALAVIILRRR